MLAASTEDEPVRNWLSPSAADLFRTRSCDAQTSAGCNASTYQACQFKVGQLSLCWGVVSSRKNRSSSCLRSTVCLILVSYFHLSKCASRAVRPVKSTCHIRHQTRRIIFSARRRASLHQWWDNCGIPPYWAAKPFSQASALAQVAS